MVLLNFLQNPRSRHPTHLSKEEAAFGFRGASLQWNPSFVQREASDVADGMALVAGDGIYRETDKGHQEAGNEEDDGTALEGHFVAPQAGSPKKLNRQSRKLSDQCRGLDETIKLPSIRWLLSNRTAAMQPLT
ncbi:unnamed protein product [Dibothriocephalus latus]|uniref:Uncharacterized protein n=1 Tax=Dibothriocephalus latus TaxID=60516 RepID=A0A3P7M1W1_DIBLA|nr:unnamed protein product [Dibothriocephalus latus]